MFRIVTHRVAGLVFSHGWFWRLVQRVPGLRERINGVYISAVVNSPPPRPYPLSLWSPGATPANYHRPPLFRAPAQVTHYVSWAGLVDRGYTGRHLPPVPPGSDLPAPDDLKELFARSKNSAGKEVMLKSSISVLFCFFAQWFIDSFLRADGTARLSTPVQCITRSLLFGPLVRASKTTM